MFVSFLAYTPLFFWARGNVTAGRQDWWKFQINRDKNYMKTEDPDSWQRRSIAMLAFVASPSCAFSSGSNIAYYSYPLVFAVITLPLSVVRFKSGFGSKTRHLATETFAVEFLYSLSGALNVLLIIFTRSDILRSQGRRQGVAPKAPSAETEPAERSQGQPQIPLSESGRRV
jgi:hypothetical protein